MHAHSCKYGGRDLFHPPPGASLASIGGRGLRLSFPRRGAPSRGPASASEVQASAPGSAREGQRRGPEVPEAYFTRLVIILETSCEIMRSVIAGAGCMHAYIHKYNHTHIHTYVHTYIRTYTHKNGVRIHVHTYIHAYVHTYIHAYIRTYMARVNACTLV